ncbi:MAG: HAMP domain-containing histidine kinase, partial [Rhodospirillales bacterium]
AVSGLVDAVMEMRRFEKNYFLYREPGDLSQYHDHAMRAQTLLGKHSDLLAGMEETSVAGRLGAQIDLSRAKMDGYVRNPSQDGEAEVRAAGKDMTASVHELASWRRNDLHRATRLHRYVLIGVVAGGLLLIVIAGTLVSLGVTRPLRMMQNRMEEVAAGRLERLDLTSGDAEIRSLANAFNRVIGELELRRQQMLVSQKLASLGVMLSGVAHELNNPLSNISTSCQILIEEGPDIAPAFLKDHLLQMDEQIERARRIVASLLDFSRHQRFLKETLLLKPLALETLAFVRGQLPAGVGVELSIPDDLELPADRQRLQQVLLNLLKNAAEASGPMGQVRLSARAEESDVVIEVADDGCGIEEADLPHVFDPFFTTKEVGKGAGLGLFIVHDIVKKHGGSISASSEQGKGTRFLIRLPLGDKTQ